MKQLIFYILCAAFPLVLLPQEVFAVDDYFYSSSVCTQERDKNKGHGNDPYIELTMNIEAIGTATITGDFDIDNPGVSLDKQMNIMVNEKEILWTSLSNSQKQQLEDELYQHLCGQYLYPD